MYICDIASCTGCFACKSICPKDAIKVTLDEMGRTIPSIAENICIECGLCKKICPANHVGGLNTPKCCYAIWTKSEEDRKLCSSGGVSTGVARQIIKDGGIVFGAAYDEHLNLVMKPAITEEELNQFRGSKYVQCSTGESFVQAKEFLLSGKEVLYVATPCQIAGLQSFLQKKYDNLYTIDIICHGTPPIKYLHDYCKEKFKGKKVTKVTFRGEKNYYFTAYENEKIIYSKPFYQDMFLWAFMECLTQRENCYTCKYAQEQRVADITIGDFWGLNRTTMIEFFSGRISVLLINSDQGKRLFELVKDQFCYEERNIQEAVSGNAQLRRPSQVQRERAKFLEKYVEHDVIKALKATGIKMDMRRKQLHEGKVNQFILKVLRKLKGMVR